MWIPIDGGAFGNSSIFHALSKSLPFFLAKLAGLRSCRNLCRFEVTAQRWCSKLINCPSPPDISLKSLRYFSNFCSQRSGPMMPYALNACISYSQFRRMQWKLVNRCCRKFAAKACVLPVALSIFQILMSSNHQMSRMSAEESLHFFFLQIRLQLVMRRFDVSHSAQPILLEGMKTHTNQKLHELI